MGVSSRPIFRAGKTSKIPFLGLSLPLNPTETHATQASLEQVTQPECEVISGVK